MTLGEKEEENEDDEKNKQWRNARRGYEATGWKSKRPKTDGG